MKFGECQRTVQVCKLCWQLQCRARVCCVGPCKGAVCITWNAQAASLFSILGRKCVPFFPPPSPTVPFFFTPLVLVRFLLRTLSYLRWVFPFKTNFVFLVFYIPPLLFFFFLSVFRMLFVAFLTSFQFFLFTLPLPFFVLMNETNTFSDHNLLCSILVVPTCMTVDSFLTKCTWTRVYSVPRKYLSKSNEDNSKTSRQTKSIRPVTKPVRFRLGL